MVALVCEWIREGEVEVGERVQTIYAVLDLYAILMEIFRNLWV